MAAMQLSMMEEKIRRGDYSFLDDHNANTNSNTNSRISSSSSLAELNSEHKKMKDDDKVELKPGEMIVATGQFRAAMHIGAHVYVILTQDEFTMKQTR
jgi:hypothetical protein